MRRFYPIRDFNIYSGSILTAVGAAALVWDATHGGVGPSALISVVLLVGAAIVIGRDAGYVGAFPPQPIPDGARVAGPRRVAFVAVVDSAAATGVIAAADVLVRRWTGGRNLELIFAIGLMLLVQARQQNRGDRSRGVVGMFQAFRLQRFFLAAD